MAKMELGAEPKRVAILIGLMLVAGYLFYTGVFSSGVETSSAPPKRPAVASGIADDDTDPASVKSASSRPAPKRGSSGSSAGSRAARTDFKPTLRVKAGEDSVDLSKIDPTLRLDRLAKLSEVRLSGVGRSLFEFGSAPPPVAAKPKLPEPKIVPKAKPIGPMPAPPPPPPPVKPPPPPINLKFYGSSLPVGGGVKRVFCMVGEEVLTPAEGDIVQKRYKIVRITATSVVVEDLQFKHQQTLPIDTLPRSS